MKTKVEKDVLKDKKGERTRGTIVSAARRVFSQHPYHTASMRMIGKEAGVEHPLINYYFPTKARLFETIVKDICDEFIRLNEEWLGTVRKMKTSEGFTKYIDLLLDFNDINPEALRILALNISQTENISQIPGYEHFPGLIEGILKSFSEQLSVGSNSNELRMFVQSFNFLVISFLGASACIAQVQGMNPGESRYRDWVRSTLFFIFLPRLREIIISAAGGGARGKNTEQ
jgi:AcrR family transcriptional regulator